MGLGDDIKGLGAGVTQTNPSGWAAGLGAGAGTGAGVGVGAGVGAGVGVGPGAGLAGAAMGSHSILHESWTARSSPAQDLAARWCVTCEKDRRAGGQAGRRAGVDLVSRQVG